MKAMSQEVYYDATSGIGTMGVGGRGNEADNADLNVMTLQFDDVVDFFMALHLLYVTPTFPKIPA